MIRNKSRRTFIKNTAVTAVGLGITNSLYDLGLGSIASDDIKRGQDNLKERKVGIIGLDTSHSVAFTKALNNPQLAEVFSGYKVVAAYPHGSKDIKSSVERIPRYTEEVKKYGVEIVASIDSLIEMVDVVLLETNDGRLHLEQALPVMKAGKRLFIDKPLAASLADAIAIFQAANKYKVPVFSSSSLRFDKRTQEIAAGKVIGPITGADTYCPGTLENTHPDLFWYGIHGVETLFTILGKGCKEVARTHTRDADIAVGTWADGRVGTFRGFRTGKKSYGGTVFGETGIAVLEPFGGYDPLLREIIEFFKTGNAPVSQEETLEIFAFMEAADESKRRGGVPVSLQMMFDRAQMAYR